MCSCWVILFGGFVKCMSFREFYFIKIHLEKLKKKTFSIWDLTTQTDCMHPAIQHARIWYPYY